MEISRKNNFIKKSLYLTVVLLTLVVIKSYGQQDPLYNLYSFNQYMINPAYAGIYNNFSANLITRKQWANIEG